MTSTIDPFRANSIRVLAKIMDASMIGGIERFLKQSIVDKNPLIVASTLVQQCNNSVTAVEH
jgi:coatomer protein complex subunit gamma